MDKFEGCIKTFRERIHVEIETLIGCRDDAWEQNRILGRIEATADLIRFMEGRAKSAS